jgi:hypothetical protein
VDDDARCQLVLNHVTGRCSRKLYGSRLRSRADNASWDTWITLHAGASLHDPTILRIDTFATHGGREMFLLLFMASLQVSSGDAIGRGAIGQWSSYVLGQRWDFTVQRADLERTPPWLESDENPPLSPRRAIASASTLLGRLIPAANAWRFSAVLLQPVGGADRWVYLVGFSEPPPGPLGGIGPMPLQFVVLMNGVAVEPTRSPWPVRHNQ